MDFIVHGLRSVIPEIMLGFNETSEDDKYSYDRLIVKEAYTFNHSQQVDLILSRAEGYDRKRSLTLPMFRRYAKYAIDVNMKKYRSISEDTEVELKKKCYVIAQSSFTRGCTVYHGSMSSTLLLFDRIIIHPALF